MVSNNREARALSKNICINKKNFVKLKNKLKVSHN